MIILCISILNPWNYIPSIKNKKSMKKNISLLVFVFIGFSTFAQIQRKNTVTTEKSDFAKLDDNAEKVSADNKTSKRTLLQDLNLTKTQKIALREIQQASKAKKEIIMNDATLGEDEKNKKLKANKINTAFNLSKILTPEQIEQMKKNRKDKNDVNDIKNEEN